MTMPQRWALAVVTALLIALPALLWRIDTGAPIATCAAPTLGAAPQLPAPRSEPRPSVVECGAAGRPLRGGAAILFGQAVDINSATASELAEVPGVSCTLARAIVDDRALRGRYATIDELRRVPGVGAKRLARLAPVLTTGAAPPGVLPATR